MLEEVRRLLLPRTDEIIQRIVADLLHNRDFCAWEANAYKELCWSIERAWHASQHPNTVADYASAPRPVSQEDVKKWLAERIAAIEKGPEQCRPR